MQSMPTRRRGTALLAAGLALALALTAAGPALAESPPPEPAPAAGSAAAPQVSRDQAIATARTVFAIPAELGEPSVSFHQSSHPGSRARWNLSWRSREGQTPALQYNVSIDAVTGEAVGYRFQRTDEESLPPLSLTRREAQARAEEVVARLAGTYAAHLQLRQQRLQEFYFYPGAPAVYRFDWERLHEGYPVMGEGVQVAIDARTGDLVSYDVNWNHQLTFTPVGAPISPRAAELAYRDHVRLELAYDRFWQPGLDQPTWKLVYASLPGYPLVDAATGELLNRAGEPADLTLWSDLAALPAADQPYTPPQRPLTQEEALGIARAASGQSRAPSGMSYHETNDPYPQQSYQFNWQAEADRTRSYDVSVDALTGLINHFGSWGPGPADPEQATPAVDEAGARAAAEAWVARFRPDLTGQVRWLPTHQDEFRWCRPPGTEQDPEQPRPICDRYDFRFQMFHQGIPVIGMTGTVSVDLWTGQVANFWGGNASELGRAEVPAATGVITAGEALDAFLTHQALKAVWITFHERFNPMRERTAAPPQAALVYMPDSYSQSFTVDAFTGHILDGSGRDLNKLAAEPQDLEGHWAQKELELLLVRGVMELDEAARIYPDQAVTRGEAAQWLVLARGLRPFQYMGRYAMLDAAAGSGSPTAQKAARFAEAALDAGIILPGEVGQVFAPEQPVSREEFALWAVRAMGYGAIARMKAPIQIGYSDAARIGAPYRNAVGILAGLEVVGATGEFRPQAAITRAEAAQILVAVASERRS